MKVVFMGTPDFAVPSLDILVKNKIDVVGVVTAPDKPAGRGQKLVQTPVKKYALDNNLNLLQPEKLKDPDFVEQLKALQADLQVVVAFRMLPEIVWNMPPKGTFNLHASLLPQYRGAAPINWAIVNGERETGITTFFLTHEIDTGSIIDQEKILISEEDNASTIHDQLMVRGAALVLKTVKTIKQGTYTLQNQTSLIKDTTALKPAPKITKETCRINWNNKCGKIFDFVRGFSPYPAAWTELISPEGTQYPLKIYKTTIEKAQLQASPGCVISDNCNFIKIAMQDGFVYLEDIQLAGKNRMNVKEFLRGFKLNENWQVK